MIIKTKNKKFYPHAKLIVVILLLSMVPLCAGYVLGVATATKFFVGFGLNFIDLDPILKRDLLSWSYSRWKNSQGWLLDPNSPFTVNQTNSFVCNINDVQSRQP